MIQMIHKKNQVYTTTFHSLTNFLLVMHVHTFASGSIGARAATGSGEWIGDRKDHRNNGDRIEDGKGLEIDMYTDG